MGESALIEAVVGALAVVAIILGYALGELHRRREADAERERQLASYEAAFHALAEDYDPPDEPDDAEHRHKKLPPGWAVIEGGGMGALVALVVAWGSRHRRTVAAVLAGAASAAVIAVALLGHGAGVGVPPAIGRHPSPLRTVSTAHTTPLGPPATRPHPTHRTGISPLPLTPVRSRRRPPTPTTTAPPEPQPPTETSTPRLSRGPAPSASSLPASPPTSGCPTGLTLHIVSIGVVICV